MSYRTEGATESIEAVRFGFFTDEEVRKHSFVQSTSADLLHGVVPAPGGLYDPLLGPLDDRAPCKSCGQSGRCPGHCGHVALILPVYNPLLFNMLYAVLQRTCFFCHHFRAIRSKVENCISQLELIMKGNVIGAKNLDSLYLEGHSNQEDSDGSHVSSTVSLGAQYHSLEHSKQQKWTSLQLTEAMSILDNFLKPKHVDCKNCGAKNPKITKPTFGWFKTSMPDAHARANRIKGCKLKGSFVGEIEEDPSSDIENADNTSPWGNGSDTSEITPINETKRKKNKRGQAHPELLKESFSGSLLPSEVRALLKLLWENEFELCSFICDIQRDSSDVLKDNAGYSMFFLDTILVPPIKFRPPSKGGDSVMEHPQTVLLGKVIEANMRLGNAYESKSGHSKTVVDRWIALQQSVNVSFDSKTMGQGQRVGASGICQLLEKKDGIFRQKMMGKRVNFACRSVISPDPYLAVNEIGIPPYFALRLTYPERVTPWNIGKLRDAIINGSEIHPGATHYADKSSVDLLQRRTRQQRISISRKLPSSRGVVTQPGKSGDIDFEGKIVSRHLQDGDIVLVNRQPTLHKPSIMAHVVRVLKGEKTLRMHYANCSTYNADFDGDEMNVHFPQDEISRAEAYNIVNANNQYVVPSRGEPIRALIQDHIISAVLLTKKDTFLSRDEYSQLLYSSGVSTSSTGSFSCKPGQKVCLVSEDEMQTLQPAILKPEPLWTGKQVITAVLNHITKGHPPFTVEKEGKIPREYFGSNTGEDDLSVERKTSENEAKKKEEFNEEILYVSKNDLVRGVIDKAQFGSYGLVHTVQELYGPKTAGILLSAFSRLFTVFLQMHGFTCGVDDLLILKYRDIERKQELEKCQDFGELENCKENEELEKRKDIRNVYSKFLGIKYDEIDPKELPNEIEYGICRYGEVGTTSLDNEMRKHLSNASTEVNKDLFVKGLLKPFPKNCFSLMTTTGAKGGMVNFQQVSSLLGQQDLEGKRVPRMVSGKTLPSFLPWDWSPRAGGFISDNFLTGLHPQEYYFHCMAGREGLVDTAVKTSRSGYLQRCLIKNLECLKVCYDHTVRDADGSIIQFSYGEDGVDVHQTSFISKFKALEENHQILREKFLHHLDKSNSYIEHLPPKLEKKAREFIKGVPEKKKHIDDEDFMKLMNHKYFSSLAQPGEPVGVLAAQSVGEPSTQMTLNTFHLAGRGEMNVTLGIPRLQEILMTASVNIKTPIMTCPLLKEKSTDEIAKGLAQTLKKVTVGDITENIYVGLRHHLYSRVYTLVMNLYRPASNSGISLKDYKETLTIQFVRELEDAIHNQINAIKRMHGIQAFDQPSQSKASKETDEEVSGMRGEENDDDGDVSGDEGADDLGLDAQKRKRQSTDEVDYDDASEDEPNEGVLSTGFEQEKENGNCLDTEMDGDDVSRNSQDAEMDGDDDASNLPSESQSPSKRKSSAKKKKTGAKKRKRQLSRKDADRSIEVKFSSKKCKFTIKFKFTDEDPHILLQQVALNVAKKVYIKSAGDIEHCQKIDCSNGQVLCHSNVSAEEKKRNSALLTAGVDFKAFWEMQENLDVNCIYSNNIHSMLKTYGVEAARESIIREVSHVFNSYGITVDIRHLTLIADFMTHSGGYNPMSRSGGIAESVSPFSKITFETASKFIVEAALYGLTDDLESPSARVCLGLPVKVGTGCFDVMQKVDI